MEYSNSPLPRASRVWLLVFLAVFAVAMGYFEAAVVVYLRALYYPEGFSFPLKMIEPSRLLVELGREASTLVMLMAAARLAGRSFYERFAFFMVMFALWDIFYYVWLKVLLCWPPGLLTWDILFLIPLPWIGPILSPVLVSLSLLTGAGLILRRLWAGGAFAPNFREWAIALGGALLILLSYMADLDAGLGASMPKPYRWELLAAGLGSGFYALGRSLLRTRNIEREQLS